MGPEKEGWGKRGSGASPRARELSAYKTRILEGLRRKKGRGCTLKKKGRQKGRTADRETIGAIQDEEGHARAKRKNRTRGQEDRNRHLTFSGMKAPTGKEMRGKNGHERAIRTAGIRLRHLTTIGRTCSRKKKKTKRGWEKGENGGEE